MKQKKKPNRLPSNKTGKTPPRKISPNSIQLLISKNHDQNSFLLSFYHFCNPSHLYLKLRFIISDGQLASIKLGIWGISIINKLKSSLTTVLKLLKDFQWAALVTNNTGRRRWRLRSFWPRKRKGSRPAARNGLIARFLRPTSDKRWS